MSCHPERSGERPVIPSRSGERPVIPSAARDPSRFRAEWGPSGATAAGIDGFRVPTHRGSPFSRSPVLPFSRSPVLPFSRSPVLPFSRSPVPRSPQSLPAFPPAALPAGDAARVVDHRTGALGADPDVVDHQRVIGGWLESRAGGSGGHGDLVFDGARAGIPNIHRRSERSRSSGDKRQGPARVHSGPRSRPGSP
jgi:hypothetical protein